MYRPLDAVVVRATALPDAAFAPSWPDLIELAGAVTWRPWLEQTLATPGFAAALEHASPVLAERARAMCAGADLPETAQRRAVLSVLRYRLRATGRATPFGRWAGITAAGLGDAAKVRFGAEHQPYPRAGAGWMAEVITELETDPRLRRHLLVRANNLIREHDDRAILAYTPGHTPDGAPVTATVRLTPPIRAALEWARRPIQWGELADRLATEAPGGTAEAAGKLVAAMVRQRFLLTSLRPPMAESDPLGHLLAHLRAAPAQGTSPAAALPETATDLHLDADVCLPHAVADEAAAAATALVRLARRLHLSPGWTHWHSAFLDRYGPRALVPVADAVDAGTGLGYPADYLDSASAAPTVVLTDRDRRLLALAQQAALYRQREIVLDDATLNSLAPQPAEGAPTIQPSTELTVHLAASSEQALSDGDFQLTVLGVSRAAGTSVGRFLPLLGAEDRERLRGVYTGLPAAVAGALPVQISAPPLHTRTQNVARVPRVLAHLLPVGEFHQDGDEVIALEDLAVTADAHRLYLVSLSRRRVLAPMLFNAVDLHRHTHPLARFLAEIGAALASPCAGFDWGAAAGLPFLPAVRYGKTILAPARWRLDAGDLPGPDAPWPQWQDALARWRELVGAPARLAVAEGDRVLRLDLAVPAHRALLRAHLQRTTTALLTACPAPDANGWAGGHTAEVVIPLAATIPPTPAPPWLATPIASPVRVREHGHLPGGRERFSLLLYGHPDQQSAILARHLPRLLADLDESGLRARSWFLRYHDPSHGHHLRLRVTVPAGAFAAVAARLAEWQRSLRTAGLLTRTVWDTYFPEVARFGGPAALDAAEDVFATDSASALAQLQAANARGGPDLRAVTAASMLDLAIGLLGEPGAAMRWLIVNTCPSSAAPGRALYEQAVALAHPHDPAARTALPYGGDLAAAWARRRDRLADYRHALPDPAALLPDLLHLHHARSAGLDPDREALCLHLARAAALSWSARTRSGT
ncbi:lantibiotic dehydratase [Nonomuraea sp. NPDC050394]|uniref:lantibiotic dehydratase n=1 Tax=Nonomuraea sp. NPDC050394 TaxID=3364363 RepID=UPI003788B711